MKRVFISFKIEDQPQVNGLRLLAANPNYGLEFYDESVRTPFDSTNADYIRRKIREKINRTSVTVCLVSETTHTSKWVAWELQESIDKGKAIYCMGVPKAPDRLILPAPLRTAKIGWFRWDVEALKRKIDAIS